MSNDSFTIQDSVHGLMKFPSQIKGLLSTAELRRLKGISQLGLAHELYPGVEHSRFAHSLGVAHVAERFVEQLEKVKNNLPESVNKFETWVDEFTLAPSV